MDNSIIYAIIFGIGYTLGSFVTLYINIKLQQKFIKEIMEDIKNGNTKFK